VYNLGNDPDLDRHQDGKSDPETDRHKTGKSDSDTDRHQNGKWDPDTDRHQTDADPQHRMVLLVMLISQDAEDVLLSLMNQVDTLTRYTNDCLKVMPGLSM
jgi:hypothetical protein